MDAWETMCTTLVGIPSVSVVSHPVGVFFFSYDGPGSKCGARSECVALVCGVL